MTDKSSGNLKTTIAQYTYRTLKWGRDHVPPGIRTLIGILFMIGGVFGFLPVLGFWMFPLGMAFVALDIPGTRKYIDNWLARLHVTAYNAPEPATDEAENSSEENTPQ